MALELIVENLDSVPEAAKSMYVAHEGKFRLDVNVEDTKGLKSALEKERQAAKDAKAELAKYSGIDLEKLKAQQKLIETNEEARLLSEGKTDEVFQNRTEKWRAEVELQKKELADKVSAAEAKANAFKDRVLDNELRAAAIAVGAHKDAIDDILLRGKGIFTLDEDGRAIQLDGNGHPVLGKDGKSKFGATEWAEGLKATARHLFPVANSGSPDGGKQVKGGGKDFSNLPPVERLTAARAAAAGQRK